LEEQQLRECLYRGLSVGMAVHNGVDRSHYRTRIERVGSTTLTLGAPYAEGGFLPLQVGTDLKVFFTHATIPFVFRTTIVGREAGDMPAFEVEFPKWAEKAQRRQFVRIPCYQPLTYQTIEDEGAVLGPPKKSLTLDLSAGGVMIRADEKMDEGMTLVVHLPVKAEILEIYSRVIRVQKIDNAKGYQYSLEFLNVSERTQDKIMGYVFAIQRDLRRRGLI